MSRIFSQRVATWKKRPRRQGDAQSRLRGFASNPRDGEFNTTLQAALR